LGNVFKPSKVIKKKKKKKKDEEKDLNEQQVQPQLPQAPLQMQPQLPQAPLQIQPQLPQAPVQIQQIQQQLNQMQQQMQQFQMQYQAQPPQQYYPIIIEQDSVPIRNSIPVNALDNSKTNKSSSQDNECPPEYAEVVNENEIKRIDENHSN